MLSAIGFSAAAFGSHLIVSSQSFQRLAEASSVSGDSMAPFLQYGVLGLVVVGFATGWIVPGPQAKALAAENTRLSALIENKLLPMIETSSAALERAAIAMEKCTDALDRRAALEAVEADRRTRA